MRNWLRNNGAMLLALAAVAVAVLTTVQASALSRKFASPTSVAVVDWLAITEKVDEWKEALTQVKKMEDGLVEELAAIDRRLKDLRESIAVLPEGSESRLREEDKYIRASIEHEALKQFAANKLRTEKAKRQVRLYQKISAAVGRVAERDGWQVVLWDDSKSKYPDLPSPIDANKLEQAAELIGRRQIFYTRRDAVDITDAVVLLMNNEFSAGR